MEPSDQAWSAARKQRILRDIARRDDAHAARRQWLLAQISDQES